MQQKTLQQFIDDVVYEAGIDGQSISTGRHSFANLVSRFNVTWDSVLELAARAGQIEALEESTAATLPAATGNEDFSIIAWPTTAVSVHSIDVFGSGTDGWESLEPIRFANRRLPKKSPDRLGWWAIKKLPKENGTTVTAGDIAVFPETLAGFQYKVYYREAWLPIPAASTTNVIIGYPDWFQWAVNSMVQIITKRDTNKKDTFAAATLLKNEAEAAIKSSAQRRSMAIVNVPRRVDGMDL